jgi:hypothetical protein
MKVKPVIIILIVSLMNLGCLFDPINTSRIDFIKMDKPVMLGKVRKIGGATIQPGAKKLDLDYSHYTADTSAMVTWIANDRFDVYGDLKKKIIAPDDLIKVDTVYFRSRFVLFIAYASCRTITGIQGGIYEGNSVNQIKGKVEKTRYPGEKP